MAHRRVARRWTDTFERIPDGKRQRVLERAKSAFARHGFGGTNVNLIAQEAGISVGSLYQYFRSKEDIFLALIEHSHGILTTIIEGIFERETAFFPRVEAILKAAVTASRTDPELLNLYIACTTEELAPLAARLSGRIEDVAVALYRRMVVQGRERGEIRSDADEAATAFCLDNLFMMVQFSYGSAYYKERLALFLGKGAAARPSGVLRGVMDFIRRALEPR
jgi:TetR/AcrR family transcriptional regulator